MGRMTRTGVNIMFSITKFVIIKFNAHHKNNFIAWLNEIMSGHMWKRFALKLWYYLSYETEELWLKKYKMEWADEDFDIL